MSMQNPVPRKSIKRSILDDDEDPTAKGFKSDSAPNLKPRGIQKQLSSGSGIINNSDFNQLMARRIVRNNVDSDGEETDDKANDEADSDGKLPVLTVTAAVAPDMNKDTNDSMSESPALLVPDMPSLLQPVSSSSPNENNGESKPTEKEILSLIELREKRKRFINLWFREKAEESLRAELEKNPFFPFTKLPNGDFLFTERLKRLYLFSVGLVLCIIALIVIQINNAGMQLATYLPFAVAGVVICIAGVNNYKEKRSFLISGQNGFYQYWVGNTLKAQGPMYNIYIRLMRQRTGSKRRSYFLVLQGYGLTQYRLCGLSLKVDEIRSLGQRLAANLGINYFDEANTSEHHKVRHLRKSMRDEQLAAESTNQLQNAMSRISLVS